MSTRRGRSIRGWLAAIGSTFAAAFSHVVAGGGHPPMFAILLALAFSGLACTMLAGRSFCRPRLVLSVFASQLIYHGLFSFFGAPGTGATGLPASHGHHHTFGAGAITADGIHWNAGMVASHAVAAVATVMLMLFGEALARNIVSYASLAVAFAVRRVVRATELLAGGEGTLAHAAPMPSVVRSIRADALELLRDSLLRRGPPALAAR
jgi:hypothetical protein